MFHCRSVSHHQADLALRERLNLTHAQQQAWLADLEGTEAVILATCNRLELYAHGPTGEQMDALWADLLSKQGVAAGAIAPYTVSHTGLEAARHLFRVSCGLESMALGEPQILGQVTRAYEQAHEHGVASNSLSLLFRAAIHTAKRARTETRIGSGSASVSSLGINKAEAVLGSLADRNVVIIGAGEMAQTVIKALAQRGVTQITVVSRTFDNARRLAEQWDVCARPITDLKAALLEADLVFTTSNAPFTILAREDVEPIMAERAGRRLCLIDIAMPRDIDPAVSEIPGVCLSDLDDLQHVIEESLAERQRTVPDVERIIEEELAAFWADYQGRTIAPTIRQLREQAERIRQAELSRIFNRLDDEQARALMEQFSHRFMNKMLHHLTRNLKARASQDDGAWIAAVARDLFGLEDSA